MTIFYFTATGNSLAVAKRIGDNLISIPQVIDNQTHSTKMMLSELFFLFFAMLRLEWFVHF